MKKLIIALVVVSLTVTTLFAAPIFQIGPTAEYQYKLKDMQNSGNVMNDLLDIKHWQFGADFRVNLWFLQIGLNGLYGNVEGYHYLNSVLTANVLINPVDFLTIAVGMGPSMSFGTKDFKTFIVNGNDISQFGEVFMNSPLYYRAQVGFDFGMLGLSVGYMLPTKGSFKNFSADTFIPAWDNGKFSASVLFNFL